MFKKKKKSAVDSFLALPADERERQWKEMDKEFVAETFTPPTAEQRKVWEKAKARRPGRPKVGKGVQVISMSVEKGLLKKADAQAKARGISRSELFAEGLRRILPKAG